MTREKERTTRLTELMLNAGTRQSAAACEQGEKRGFYSGEGYGGEVWVRAQAPLHYES